MDISEKLNALLSSPDGMQKLQDAAGQLEGVLGGDTNLSGILSSLAPPAPKPSPVPDFDLSLLTKAAPFLQAMSKEDDSTKLLHALRPYLPNERQQMLDDAIQILKWVRLATMLKEQGFFDSLKRGG